MASVSPILRKWMRCRGINAHGHIFATILLKDILRYYKGISSLQLIGLVVFGAEYQSLISYLMPHVLKTDF